MQLTFVKDYENWWRFEFNGDLCRDLIDRVYNLAEQWDCSKPGSSPDALIDELIDIIDKSPFILSAYSLLGVIFDDCDRQDLAYEVWGVGVRIALAAMPSEFDFTKDRIGYHTPDNRPFFVLYYWWGLIHLQKAKQEELSFLRRQNLYLASNIFQNLISINPSDNLDARALLIEAYLALEQYREILSVCKLYQDEFPSKDGCDDKETTHPDILYGRVLSAIKLHKTAKAPQWLAVAIERRPLIAEILLLDDPRQPKTDMSGFITAGGADEAYSFWERYHSYWHNCPKAMQLLRDNQHLIEQAKADFKDRWENGGFAIPKETRRPFPDYYSLELSGVV